MHWSFDFSQSGGGGLIFHSMNFFLPMAYYWTTALMAMDFLQHRSRMPFIYLSSFLPSRDAFFRATALSYLLMVFKQAVIITIAAIVSHLIFPWTSWTNFPQLCILGFIFSFIQVSLSLLASKLLKSASALIWFLINFLIFIPIPHLARQYTNSWTIALAALLSGFLFWLALHRWAKSDLDFAGA